MIKRDLFVAAVKFKLLSDTGDKFGAFTNYTTRRTH